MRLLCEEELRQLQEDIAKYIAEIVSSFPGLKHASVYSSDLVFKYFLRDWHMKGYGRDCALPGDDAMVQCDEHDAGDKCVDLSDYDCEQAVEDIGSEFALTLAMQSIKTAEGRRLQLTQERSKILAELRVASTALRDSAKLAHEWVHVKFESIRANFGEKLKAKVRAGKAVQSLELMEKIMTDLQRLKECFMVAEVICRSEEAELMKTLIPCLRVGDVNLASNDIPQKLKAALEALCGTVFSFNDFVCNNGFLDFGILLNQYDKEAYEAFHNLNQVFKKASMLLMPLIVQYAEHCFALELNAPLKNSNLPDFLTPTYAFKRVYKDNTGKEIYSFPVKAGDRLQRPRN